MAAAERGDDWFRQRRQFIGDNVLATSSTLFAGVLGFALQAATSHALEPSQYGKTFSVITFFTLLTRPAAAFGRLVAWQTSQELAHSGSTGLRSAILLRQTLLRLLTVGSIVAAASIVVGSVVGRYLHVPLADIAVAAVAVPFMLATQPLLGRLQGQRRFLPWSVLSVFVTLSRLIIVPLFIMLAGAFGLLLGTTLATVVTFIVCLIPVSPQLRASRGSISFAPVVPFVVVAIASTLAIGLFLGADVLVVEHYFNKLQGGQYAAVSVVGNAVFFATGGVASVVFPLIAARHARDRSTFGVMGASLGLCAVTGLVGTLGLQLFGRLILTVFAGKKYAPGAHYLGWYALGMAVLSSVVVLVNTQQSLNRLYLLWVLVPVIVLRPALLLAFHGSLLTVVAVSDISVGVFAVVIGAMYVINERSRQRRPRAEHEGRPDEHARSGSAAPIANGPSVVAAPTEGGALMGAEGELGPRPGDDPSDTDGDDAALASPAVEHATVGADGAPPPTAVGPGSMLHQRTAWLVDRPAMVLATLAGLGVLVRHAWLTTLPLASGDWHWPARGRILAWHPWPTVWDSTLGFSGENRFLDAFRFPVFAVSGAIAALGGSWTLIEKVVYYIPLAVLLPAAGWLLAREILGRTRWGLIAPLLFVGNTYFLIQGNGEVPLVLAEVVGCLTLVAFLRSIRRRSLSWGLVTGLGLGATTAFDIRPTFLTILMMVGYLVVLGVAEASWRLFRDRVLIAGASLATFVVSQLFWLLPFVTYHGHKQLPTPQAPNFNIITLGHGIAGVNATWSGGAPATLVQAPLNPLFMVIPLIAMIPLLGRRMRPELLWLALSAVICAFLAKTNTPPLGGVYDWIYLHVPGFRLFREGSKFFYPIALAYATLIPAALQSVLEQARSGERRRTRAVRAFVAAALALVVLVSGSSLLVLERSQLGSTTTPVAQPQSFVRAAAVLQADHKQGSVLWFGSPVFGTDDQKEHRYVIASTAHPIVNMTGNGTATHVNKRDVLQYFCPALNVPYCYVNPAVFRYLAAMVGASWVISPAGGDVGHLPAGVTRAWLRNRLTAILGPPTLLGGGTTQLLAWHIADVPSPVATFPAVAAVDSGPWSVAAVLPALRAMDVPAAYRQTYDSADFPPATASLDRAVHVVPSTDGGYRSSSPGSMAIMALTSDPSLDVVIGSTRRSLPLISSAERAPGWALYGPVDLPAGFVQAQTPAGITLGPAVQWSALTSSTLARPLPAPAVAVKTQADGEQLNADAGASPGAWTELRRYYDLGWRQGGHKPAAVGNGLFNLYFSPKPVLQRGHEVFTFSTLKWERRGQISSAVLVVGVLGLILVFRRRERVRALPGPVTLELESRFAPHIGALGMAFLVLTGLATALEWIGLPSRVPWTAVTGDPYSLDVLFGAAALGLLGLSLVLRLGEHALRTLALRVPAPNRVRRRAAAMATTTLLLASSCSVGGTSGNQALNDAQQAGAPSRLAVGSSLDDARLQQQAHDPRRCIADYTTALRTFPDLASAYSGRGGCYRGGGKNAGAAVHDFTRALTLTPGDPRLLLRRAAAARGIGDRAAAIRDYRLAAAAPGSDPGEQVAAVEGLLALRDTAHAGAVVAAALQRFPSDPTIQIAVADLAIAEGDSQRAAAALRRGVDLAPPNGTELSAILGRLCGQQLVEQDYTAASTTCRKSAELATDGSGAYDNLSAIDLSLGHLGAAITDLTSAIGAFQGNTGPNAQAAGVDGFGLAHLYEARGRLEVQDHRLAAAIRDYRNALEVLPSASPDFAARLRGDISTARRS